MREPRPRGPVQILCEEIGFGFDRRLEREDVFVAFVREIVGAVEERRQTGVMLHERVGSLGPSAGSAEVLALAHAMLDAPTKADRIAAAEAVHDAAHRLNPENAYPTDHLIDMLSSCASAIRFGLENRYGLGSRHAAEAANHVWKHRYGVSLFDRATGAWENDWARQRLLSALISLLPPPPPENGDRSSGEGGES